MEQKNKFEYTYTAPTEAERRETEEIRKRYQPAVVSPKTEDKLERLRSLDAKAKLPSKIVSLTVGVLGTLVFGAGMAMVLEMDFPYHEIVGVATSGIGLIPTALAYPVYRILAKKGKKKYKEEILRLSEEILNESK